MKFKDKIMVYLISLYMLLLPVTMTKANFIKANVTLGDFFLLLIFFVYLIKIIFDSDSRDRFIYGLKDFFRNPITIFGLILLVAMFVSVTYALDKKLALTESVRLSTYLITYFIIKYEINKKSSRFILVFYICSMVLICIFGVVQYFTGMGLNQKFIINYGHGRIRRIQSTFDNCNAFGAYLIIGVFPIIMLTIKHHKNKILGVIISLLIIVNIVMTGSRNALVAFGVGLLILSIIYSKKIIPLIFGVGAAVFVIPFTRYRIGDLFSKTQNESRIKLWKTAIAMIKEHPLLGIGNGNYTSRYDEYVKKYPELIYPDYHNFPTHNSYLKIQSELGIAGIFSFLGLLLCSVIKVKKFIDKTEDKFLKPFYIGFFASMMAFLFMNFFDNMFFIPQIAMSYWVIVAVCDNISSKNKSKGSNIIC